MKSYHLFITQEYVVGIEVTHLLLGLKVFLLILYKL